MLTAGVAAFVLALVHLAARRFEEALSVVPRSRWLSIGGGVSVAYVFVHLLPEIAEAQAQLEEDEALVRGLGDELWLGALAGLVIFYGLERVTADRLRGAAGAGRRTDAATWVHLGSYSLYNGLAGFLLREQADRGTATLALYTIAVAVHFLVNDHGLVEQHGDIYRAVGWGLSAVGPAAGVAVPLLLGFLAGGIVLNVLKEELPERRRSRFGTFAAAAAGYAALLIAI